MFNYKVLILLSLILITLKAEVSVILPYSSIVLDDDKSFKNNGTVSGFYTSTGTLVYLSEFEYTHTDIKYKFITENLTQDEFTMRYNRFFIDHSYKIGIHTNSTTDVDLQNGTTLIIGLNKWSWIGTSKFTYGGDIYNSSYANGKDLNDNNSSVNVLQFTGYASYYKPFKWFSNTISLKLNIESISAYEKNYLSFELKNIIYYKKLSIEMDAFIGKMQTGIRDTGSTVFNSKDILKQNLKIKVGYFITDKIKTTFSYASIVYDEYKNQDDLQKSAVAFTASYTF